MPVLNTSLQFVLRIKQEQVDKKRQHKESRPERRKSLFTDDIIYMQKFQGIYTHEKNRSELMSSAWCRIFA